MLDNNQKIEISEVIRCLCGELSLAFSANDVSRTLADVKMDETSFDVPTVLGMAGDALGYRLRPVESGFKELFSSIAVACPVLIPLIEKSHSEQSSSGSPNTNVKRVALILGLENNGRLRVHVDGQEQTLTKKWLQKNAVLNDLGGLSWFFVLPTLVASNASDASRGAGPSDGQPSKPMSPLKRMSALLKPEMSDIRTIVIFSVVVGILSLTTPLAVEAVVNTIAFGRYLQPLVVLSLIVFVFLAFRAGISVLMTIVAEIIQRRLFARVVDDLANRLVRVPVAHLRKYHGPELVNRFFDVVNVQKITSKLMLDTLMLVLQTFIGLSVLAFYHPFLLGYDIGLIAMMAVVLFLIGRGAIKTAMLESKLKYKTAAWLQEISRHTSSFQFNGGTPFAINRADELAASYIYERKRHFKIVLRQVSFSMLMQAVAATVLLGLGGYLVIDGQMTLGQLVAAELIVTVILGSFAKIGKDLESFYDLMASVDKLGVLFDLPAENDNRLQAVLQGGPVNVEIENLTVPGVSNPPIQAAINGGSTFAIVGPAGSGKSKLIDSIAGLVEAKTGHISLNGFRVDSLNVHSLGSQIGFVRHVEIFEGTVDENIQLGRHNVSSADINRVLTAFNLESDIEQLDGGLKAKLQVNGYPLSVGAAIKLTLARALINRPPLMLIDGILDHLPDEDLRETLEFMNSFKDETTFVIATGREYVGQWATDKISLTKR